MKLYGYTMPLTSELILQEDNDRKMQKMVAA